MNKKQNVRLMIGLGLSLLLVSSCSGESDGQETETTNETEEVSEEEPTNVEEEVEQIVGRLEPGEFKNRIEEGKYVLLDVRTPEEYNDGTIEGAANINFLGDSFEDEISKLDKNKKYLVFCQSGGRSQKAANTMSEKGFTEVHDLIDGYGGWPYKEK